MRRSFLLSLLVFALVATACRSQSSVPSPTAPPPTAPQTLTVSNPVARVSDDVASIYFRIDNPGDADVLEAAEVAQSELAMLHESVVENGVASMEHRDLVEIPARSTTEFKEGGLHVMVMGLATSRPATQPLELKLRFKRAGEVQLTAPVQGIAHAHH